MQLREIHAFDCQRRIVTDHGLDAGTFDGLKGFLPGAHETPSYAAMAERLGREEATVRKAVSRMRGHFGEAVRLEIGATLLLVGAAIALVAIVVALSPPLRLEARLIWESLRLWFFNVTR